MSQGGVAVWTQLGQGVHLVTPAVRAAGLEHLHDAGDHVTSRGPPFHQVLGHSVSLQQKPQRQITDIGNEMCVQAKHQYL